MEGANAELVDAGQPPTGTITFLFTDLEGSTALWDGKPGVMRGAVARHDELIRSSVGSWRGTVFAHVHDGGGVGVHERSGPQRRSP